jgi:hypothetical protein
MLESNPNSGDNKIIETRLIQDMTDADWKKVYEEYIKPTADQIEQDILNLPIKNKEKHEF